MLFLSVILILSISSLSAVRGTPIVSLDEAEALFENFIIKFEKQYANEKERKIKFEIFKKNLAELVEIQARDPTAGITQFFDLTREEFITMYTGLRVPDPWVPLVPFVNLTQFVDLPATFDWREKGVVTRVKNQQQCGSCWAFGTTGAVESAYARRHGTLAELSEQQLVDCDYYGNGCNGGWMQDAIKYLINVGGQEGESSYPYYGVKRYCGFDRSKVVARVSQLLAFDLSNGEEYTRQSLYQYGPITLTIDARYLNTYTGGILNCPYSYANHAVLLVGWGEENGHPFWIIKNSWGTSWGENGYVRVTRAGASCGIYNIHGAGALIA